jgi:hypothetical protein
VAALDNLRRLCESHLAGRYEIEVIDLLVNPTLAAGDQILAVPTLVRKFPEPIRKIIGDLSNEGRCWSASTSSRSARRLHELAGAAGVLPLPRGQHAGVGARRGQHPALL